MTHGELFLLLLLIWLCLHPLMTTNITVVIGRIVLLLVMLYNFVMWLLAALHLIG